MLNFFKSNLSQLIKHIVFSVCGIGLISISAQAAVFSDFSVPDNPQWHLMSYQAKPEENNANPKQSSDNSYTLGFIHKQESAFIQVSVLNMPDNSNITLHQATVKATAIAKTQGMKVVKTSVLKDGSNYLQLEDGEGIPAAAVVKVYENRRAILVNLFGDLRLCSAFIKTFYDKSPAMPNLE